VGATRTSLVDLGREGVIHGTDLHAMHPITPFEGRTCTARVVATIVRGRIVVRHGELLAEPGWGRRVAPVGWRRLWPDLDQRPAGQVPAGSRAVNGQHLDHLLDQVEHLWAALLGHVGKQVLQPALDQAPRHLRGEAFAVASDQLLGVRDSLALERPDERSHARCVGLGQLVDPARRRRLGLRLCRGLARRARLDCRQCLDLRPTCLGDCLAHGVERGKRAANQLLAQLVGLRRVTRAQSPS
jgi:hypothetical protein